MMVRLKSVAGNRDVRFPAPDQDDLQSLMAAARPSPFGHDDKTGMVTSVRQAVELTPDQIEVDFNHFDGILDEVSYGSRCARAIARSGEAGPSPDKG